MHAHCPSDGTGGMKNGASVSESVSGKALEAPVSWQTVNGVDSATPSPKKLGNNFDNSACCSPSLKSTTRPLLSARAVETFCYDASNLLSTSCGSHAKQKSKQ